MKEKIRVIIADDVRGIRENVKTMLTFDDRIEVIGEAENGEDVIFLAREARPDIILMDINMPGKDGITAATEISIENPEISIIMISVQNEQEYLRKAMSAGAREYIIKPFSNEDLINTVVRVYEMESKRRQKMVIPKKEGEEVNSKVITVFSTKGGVGKTTIATNLSVALAKKTMKSVALVDLDLLFGSAAIHLNISTKKNISELVKVINNLDEETMEDYLVGHFCGARILTAPIKPEYAEYITALHVEKIIKVLKKRYHYIIIDTAQNFEETTLAALDASDKILFISTMDLPTIKNVRTGLEVMETLKYPESKIHIVLNKATEQFGIKYKDFENTVNRKIWASIPEDNFTVTNAMNKGFPFVMTRTKTEVSKSISRIGEMLSVGPKEDLVQKSFLKRVFGN